MVYYPPAMTIGPGSIPVAILPSCQSIHNNVLCVHEMKMNVIIYRLVVKVRKLKMLEGQYTFY